MPRILAKKQEYKVLDLKKWIKMQMAANDMNQTMVGEALGISQEMVSKRLSNKKEGGRIVNKDPFSYGDLLILCDLFGVDKEEKEKLLTM